jgi:hypothetical protein
MSVIRGGSSLYGVSVAIYKKVSLAFRDDGEVFDGFLPEDRDEVDFPYAIIEEMTEGQENLLNRAVRAVVVTIKIYTAYRGTKQAKQLASKLVDMLEEMDLSSEEGWTFPKTKYLDTHFLREDDIRFTAIMRFEVMAEKLA